MLKKAVFLTVSLVLIFQITSFIFIPMAHAQEEAPAETGKTAWYDKYKYPLGILFLFVMIIVSRIVRQLRKDRLVKPFVKKYVNVETKKPDKHGGPYKGILRVELNGIEIISEKAREKEGRASFYLEGCNPNIDVKAYIRYLDEMTDREREEHEKQLEKVYHPSPIAIAVRKIRNAYGFFQDAFDSVFKALYNKYVKKGVLEDKLSQQEVFQELKKIETEAQTHIEDVEKKGEKVYTNVAELEDQLKSAYLGDFDYDRGLERMIGRKVNVKINDKVLPEPVVFVDYTRNFWYFMEVDYESHLTLTIDEDEDESLGEGGFDEIRASITQDGLLIESNLPFTIQLTAVEDVGRGKAQLDKEDEVNPFPLIEPYGQMIIPFDRWPAAGSLEPFGLTIAKLQAVEWEDLHNRKQTLTFTFNRMSDIVLARNTKGCQILGPAEKYVPMTMKLSEMTEGFLGDEDKREDLLITDEYGEPIRGIHFYHGYITNVDQDRIDPQEVDYNYNLRWNVEHVFDKFDKKLRPLKAPYIMTPIGKRKRVVGQSTLAEILHPDKLAKDGISQVLYSPISKNGKRYQKPAGKTLPIKVLALVDNGSRVEFPVLSQFVNIRGHRMIYEKTSDISLPRVEKAHVLWIGQGEIFKDGYQLKTNTEAKIKNFANKGGIVIVSGQFLATKTRRRYGAGWIPERLIGVDREETREFDPTVFADDLFKIPNVIEPGEVVIADAWTEYASPFSVLAKSNGGGDAAVLRLKHGDGMYLVTAFRNASREDVEINAKIMENLLYYSIEWLDEQERKNLAIA